MPTLSSFEVESGKAWGYYDENIPKVIYDTFQRAATSGTLGISTNGVPWTTLKGTWYVNSNQLAECDDSASNYSIATYDLNTTQQLVYGNPTPGMGIIFNGTDANNWWGATYTYTVSYYSCNCSSVTNCTDCGSTSYTSNCNECGNTYNYADCFVCGSSCNTCYVGSVLETSCSNCGSTCNSCYTCNSCTLCNTCAVCSTCTSYIMDILVLNSVNGTVSQITSASFNSSTDFSLAVQVSGTLATINGYQTSISGNPTLLSQITNTIVYSVSVTLTGTLGTLTGVFKSPSSTQGDTESTFYGTGIQF